MGLDFDEWMRTKDKSYVPTDDSMSLRLLRECWFRRDAEIDGLNQLIDLLSEASLNITKERNQLSEQVKMLRNELNMIYKLVPYLVVFQMEPSALAATDPKL